MEKKKSFWEEKIVEDEEEKSIRMEAEAVWEDELKLKLIIAVNNRRWQRWRVRQMRRGKINFMEANKIHVVASFHRDELVRGRRGKAKG